MTDTPCLVPDRASRYTFASPTGQKLIRKILCELLPFDPHDYQLEGVCKALNGIDVFAITATGSGKTGYFYMYILVVLYLVNNPDQCPWVSFPKDPVMLMICPTNGIEEQTVTKVEKFRLKALTLNANTLHDGFKRKENLWAITKMGHSMLMLSLEQLTQKGFQNLLDDLQFWRRIVAMGVDEAHLLLTWGLGFREAFKAIGFMPFNSVCKFLGLWDGEFHLIRRSNFRPGMQLLIRDLGCGIGGRKFPSLLWVLDSQRKTIIYCTTISLAFHITSYLWHAAKWKTGLDNCIRMYNSLNWPSYNSVTFSLLMDDARPNITIATAALEVGVDPPDVQDVIRVGVPGTIEELFQDLGRAGRDEERVDDAREILYVTGMDIEKAAEMLKELGSSERGTEDEVPSSQKPKKSEISLSMARYLLAPCLPAEQNRHFGNPSEDLVCTCQTCEKKRRATSTGPCNCSSCCPETLAPPSVQHCSRMGSCKDPLSDTLRAALQAQLLEFRVTIWEEASELNNGFTPITAFLSDNKIKLILDNFSQITSQSTLTALVTPNKQLLPHIARLWRLVEEFHPLVAAKNLAAEVLCAESTPWAGEVVAFNTPVILHGGFDNGSLSQASAAGSVAV
ncbi:hypothetical protein JAAARDRAFT_61699 [Jaapia argillacea MUCL 33604]|uniref:DNA 3'-5' helicase n=1 Tax=Jaapia argillacea MUCL 33604 TaxID=933084 RepID=A0A067PDX6_9AGAM|nr:hypothetical protein JAAARDRAFT_61699 [Jaapia argillacea MUCL 33604]